MVAVAEEENGCDKKESSENTETTSWKLSRDELKRGERKSDENRKERLLPSGSSANLHRRDIAVIVLATIPMCNVQRAEWRGRVIRGRKGTKSQELARIGSAP